MHEVGLGDVFHRLVLLCPVAEVAVQDGNHCLVLVALPVDWHDLESCLVQ